MAEQGTGWDSELDISLGEEKSTLDQTTSRLAFARMVKYCEQEAFTLNLPFVAYCLSLALGGLAEQVDDIEGGWTEPRFRPQRD